MIAVYVREVKQIDGQLLGHFLPSDVRQLPDLFKTFETHTSFGQDIIGPCQFDHAQFIVDETGTYFEIVVEAQSTS